MTLYGAMASWGEIAVGEARASSTRPSRSALIGMVSAALGITRDDDETLQRMVEAYRFAVRVWMPGVLTRDFHTWQYQKPRRGAAWLTRKEELKDDQPPDTGISYRDYFCDAAYTVCLWTVVDQPPFTLERIKEAFERPRFVLYLGRKSCPPAIPVTIRIQHANSLKEVFANTPLDKTVQEWMRPDPQDSLVFWDDDGDPRGEMTAQDVFFRRDVPLNRRAWQFTERREHFAGWSNEKGK